MVVTDYNLFKEQKIFGRYITLKSIQPLIETLNFEKEILGYSYLKQPVYKIKLGQGKIKILIWSQMHGNESTGTKAIFDLLNYFSTTRKNDQTQKEILKKCTIVIVPMLNPDGADEYTRFNAQNIDLNRDAIDLKAPESILLNSLLYEFKPNFCFNLHDQRPIFSVGDDNLPATLSFLAPSIDKERTITKGRIETMKVIVAMNNVIQQYIPDQVGRYTDEFYPTATGDNFQKEGFNTILIEAGHFIGDYEREEVRKYNFLAILAGLSHLSKNDIVNHQDYFKIPNNNKKYFEFSIENIIYQGDKVRIGVFTEEKLINKQVCHIKNFKIIPLNINVKNKKSINKELNFEEEEELLSYINSLD